MGWKKLETDPILGEFIALEALGSSLVVRRGYEPFAELLTPEGLSAPDLPIEGYTSGGRAAHPVVLLPNGERILLREYRRGGFIRHFNRRRYFFGHRAFEELRATAHAAAAGVQVPRVIAAAERHSGLGYTATLATLWIDGVTEAAEWLKAASARARAEILRVAGRQISTMHNAGIAHPDLNLRNILIREKGEVADEVSVYLIDFDRSVITPHPVVSARRARDLLRLGRSARKLGLPLEANDGWSALRSGYGSGWPEGSGIPTRS